MSKGVVYIVCEWGSGLMHAFGSVAAARAFAAEDMARYAIPGWDQTVKDPDCEQWENGSAMVTITRLDID